MTIRMSTLLKNPAYRSYLTRNVVYPRNVYHPAPWRVWAQKVSPQSAKGYKWAGKAFKTYGEAFDLLKKIHTAGPDKFLDVSISSRLIGFNAPEQLRVQYKSDGYDWCLMCRRPVQFVPMRRHHALDNTLHQYYAHFPVCPYCGIREETILTRGAITIGKG